MCVVRCFVGVWLGGGGDGGKGESRRQRAAPNEGVSIVRRSTRARRRRNGTSLRKKLTGSRTRAPCWRRATRRAWAPRSGGSRRWWPWCRGLCGAGDASFSRKQSSGDRSLVPACFFTRAPGPSVDGRSIERARVRGRVCLCVSTRAPSRGSKVGFFPLSTCSVVWSAGRFGAVDVVDEVACVKGVCVCAA